MKGKVISFLLFFAMMTPLTSQALAAETPTQIAETAHISASDASGMDDQNIYSYNQVQAGHWNADSDYTECFQPAGNYDASDESSMILYPGAAYPDDKITALVWKAVKHPTFDVDFSFEVSDNPDGPWTEFDHYTKDATDLGAAWVRGIYTLTGINSKYIKVLWPKDFGEAWEALGSGFALTATNDPNLPPPYKTVETVVVPQEPYVNPDIYNITLTGELQQEITDWGVFFGSDSSGTDGRTLLKDAVFKDMGITNYRIELYGECGGPNKTLDYDRLNQVASAIKSGCEYGIKKYLLSVWTPPPEFKTNNSISGLNADGTDASLKVENEQDYCDYIVKCLDYFTKDLGLPKPYAFDLQNEPENVADYQSCLYTPEQYVRVAKLMRKTLDAAGYTDVPLIGIGDVFLRNIKFFGNKFSQFAADPELNSAIPIVAVHAYVHPGWTSDNDVRNWRAALELYPEKQAWMTEFCTGEGLPSPTMLSKTMDLAEVLSSNMVNARINDWFWWTAFASGYEINVPNQETLLSGNGTTTLNKSMQYNLLSIIYKNAVPGSKVALLETDDPEINTAMGERIDMCAWRNDNADIVLLADTKKTTDRYYRLNNLNGKSATVYYFDEEISMNGGKVAPNNYEPKVLPPRNLENGSIVVEVPTNTVIVVVTSANDADFVNSANNDKNAVAGIETPVTNTNPASEITKTEILTATASDIQKQIPAEVIIIITVIIVITIGALIFFWFRHKVKTKNSQ
ncbi:MAG: glycosyl hydrolase [Oscillospiraceae bacterium]|nr:glycosyl hydrolase [Oscillospiraceae bacterium]